MYYAEFTVGGLDANQVEGIFYEWLNEDVSESLLEGWGFGKRDGTTGRPFAIECFVEFKDSGVSSAIYFEILLTRYVLEGANVDVTQEY